MSSTESETIKKLAIIAMFADDELMDKLVLKGANALDIVYSIEKRSSLDLDFSIPTEFDKPEATAERIKSTLHKIFNENGYEVFDIHFRQVPETKVAEHMPPPFWGGYELEFKVIRKDVYNQFKKDPHRLRVEGAIDIGPRSQKTFRIEISKWEDCKAKRQKEIDHYTIYVYSPEMIVCEKLRAICQQMPEYCNYIGRSHSSERAKDFFDIYATIEHFKIDLMSNDNTQLLKNIFKAKDVPLSLLAKISEYRDFHSYGFAGVRDTVKPSVKLKTFDFYFDYVVGKCKKLTKALGIV